MHQDTFSDNPSVIHTVYTMFSCNSCTVTINIRSLFKHCKSAWEKMLAYKNCKIVQKSSHLLPQISSSFYTHFAGDPGYFGRFSHQVGNLQHQEGNLIFAAQNQNFKNALSTFYIGFNSMFTEFQLSTISCSLVIIGEKFHWPSQVGVLDRGKINF